MTAKILLVDDDKSVREVGLFNLRRAGYETVPAEGGLEALSLFSREDFDLVITDVKMPGIPVTDTASSHAEEKQQ
jgi:CheY-like chemotaxis protein